MRASYITYAPEKPIPVWVGYATVAICFLILTVTIICVAIFTKDPSNQVPYGPHVMIKQQPRLTNLENWCYIEFNISHIGRSKNQSPSQWSRFFMPIQFSSEKEIQVTPYDGFGNITAGGLKSAIIEGYASFGLLYVGLEYWGEAPWKIYVGQDRKRGEERECSSFAVF